MKVEIKFTKVGPNKVKYRLPFRMFCKHANDFMPNSGTLPMDDGVILTWLGKAPDRLFKSRTSIKVKVELGQIYDKCDVSEAAINRTAQE